MLASVALLVPGGTLLIGSYLIGKKINEKFKEVRTRNSQIKAQEAARNSDSDVQREESISSERQVHSGFGSEALKGASKGEWFKKQEVSSNQEESQGLPDEGYLFGIASLTAGPTQINQECSRRASNNPSSRLKYNRIILNFLRKQIEKNPEARFGQILRNTNIVKETRPIKAERGADMGVEWDNEFYLESEALLIRILKTKA